MTAPNEGLGSLAAARSAAAWAALCRAERPPDDSEVEAAYRRFDAEARRRAGSAGAAIGAFLPVHERERAAQLLAAEHARIATEVAEVVEAVAEGVHPAHGARALVALAKAEGVDLEAPVADLLVAARAAGWSLADAEAAVADALAGSA